jgi:capsular polysaccharide biosynthesis protein
VSTPRNRASQLAWGGFGRLAPLSLFVAAALIVIAGGAAYEVTARRSPTYVSYSATILDQPVQISKSQDPGVIDKLARLRLKYAGLIRSDDVITPAAKAAGVSRGVVAGTLLVRVDNGSLLLYVGAQSGKPGVAIKVANALATSLAGYVDKEQKNAAIPAPDRVVLNVVAPARGAQQVLPTGRQKLVSGAGAALVAFVVLAAALDVMRRREA